MCGNAMSALMRPISEGNVEELQSCLDRYGNALPLILQKQFIANECDAHCFGDPQYTTPCKYAIYCNQPECLDVILKSGGDPNERGLGGNTLLHKAVKQTHKDCVKILLDHGADVHNTDEWGVLPIHVASGAYGDVTDRLEIVRMLLDKGNPDDKEARDEFHKTPLHYAALYGNIKVIQLLLDMGADINIKDKTLRTPYQFAERQPKTQKFLLEKGAILPQVSNPPKPSLLKPLFPLNKSQVTTTA